jgi:hypothetical protein
MLEKQKTDQKLFDAVKSATPLIADKYGIPESAVHKSILALMRDKCTPDEASRLLFGAIAKPTAFVNVYFKVQQGDKSLPEWMRGLDVACKLRFESDEFALIIKVGGGIDRPTLACDRWLCPRHRSRHPQLRSPGATCARSRNAGELLSAHFVTSVEFALR